jgi:uncharacterized protein YecE (DUF72 family)
MDKILLGCSGWSYKEWIGPFYKTEKESMLKAYSEVFRTAEINSTFYAYPSEGTVLGWLKYTKPGFVYTAKLPKLITHKKKLNLELDTEEDVKRFCELMQPLQLNGKLGCILIQMPPGIKFGIKPLEDFFRILPTEFRFAIEFRDLSWLREETWSLLEKYRIAYTIVDEPLLPPEVRVTTDIAYIRWHGKGERPWYNYCYEKKELEPWISKVKETAKKSERVYGYFNNHFHGYAVKNCLETIEMLDILTPEQNMAKKNVDEYFEALTKAPKEERSLALAAFMPEKVREMGFNDFLPLFLPSYKVKRAKEIKDQEVVIQEMADTHFKALVRNYHLLIDFQNRIVLHDCADWSRTLLSKQFCKHIGKAMMILPKEKAVEIMRKISSEREKWEFKPYVA